MMSVRGCPMIAGVALLLASLLAVSSVAEATCAWVLWTHNVLVASDKSIVSWELQRAFDTVPACEKGAEALAAEVAQETRATLRKTARGPMVITPALSETSSYVCLPDTIDPRGPKGEGR
jgi:hypothetical protein